mmetsp:Transcript_7911/g.14372  ORF Transcript_7911/g.14372 Transcript_7911/m.14372 type:complete len:406 (+) Transcript_7911:46-1263(+)
MGKAKVKRSPGLLAIGLLVAGCANLAFLTPQRAPRLALRAQRQSAGPVVDAEEVSPISFSVTVGGFNSSNASMSGKTAVITGASTGIGLATVEGMVRSGIYKSIIMAGRDAEKHQRAMEGLREEVGTLDQAVELRYLPLELASLKSVRSFAGAVLEQEVPIHTLILNAGVMALPNRKQTEDGYEYQFGVNHLGHFLLSNLLMDKLASSGTAADPARVISLASTAHQIPSKLLKGDLGDLQSYEYSAWGAYGQSKLANVMFAYELDRRCRDRGLPVVANAVHPGVVNTELARYMGGEGRNMPSSLQDFTKPLLAYVLKSPAEGAKTSLVLATKPEGKLSGRYWQDGRPTASIDFDPAGDLPAPALELLPFRPKFTSYDPKVWAELWTESELLVGLRPEDVSCFAKK